MKSMRLAQRRMGLRLLSFYVVALLVMVVPFASAVVPSPVRAADGVAITGSFYAHLFQIPPDGQVYGSDIYVIIRNTSDQNQVLFNVRTDVLNVTDNSHVDGVDITLSPSGSGIVLGPGESKQLQVAVEVGDLVVPDQYKMWITAEPWMAPGGEVVVLPAVRMSADLEVVGESRQVFVETVGRSGEPIAVVVRLYRVVGDKRYEVAYGDIGQVHDKVAPGSYLAVAESREGDFLAEKAFEVAAGPDELKISLTVETIYFEGFAANPAYNTETGELGYVQIAYTINNVYKPVPSATVRLVVTFNGNVLEGPRVIHTYEPLQVRREGQPYDYRPVDDWKKGTYGFSLQLYTGEELYASTREVTLEVGVGAAKASWLWIIFVILGVVGAAGLGFLIFFLLKRRKKEEEKPRKAEKKQKEEKPAPKLEEPVRRPEPYRPPEPVRPVAPPPIEEPAAEPAPLASISSLKARMASMGRDQGTGKPAEEEAEAEKPEAPAETIPQPRATAPVPPPRAEPPPAVKKAEEKVQKPPVTEKPVSQKPGIFSKVTASEKKEPPKPATAHGPVPPKPDSGVQINWPPKSVEPPKPVKSSGDVQINWPPKSVEPAKPPKPPSDVQISWPPKPVEPAKPVEPSKPGGFADAARQRMQAVPPAAPPEEVAPTAEAGPAEEAAPEEPSEPEMPSSRSSFAEAARLRMEARQRVSEKGKPGAGPGEAQPEGDTASEPGEGEERPPSP